ncbi:hypothetical protein GCM10010174_80540 [Kutzneria viridogrisea]|uniref:Uncharacterized protein n=1 Tax=Kutzneria viridogrisea TaxID=47990 RepID=A0ABR6BYX5_9PSEU|nr:hypothetical protein [Kutzneria viridogrisea]
MAATKDQQVKHLVEGAALGVLATGVAAVTSGKPTLELAFRAAWRRWSRASEFPSVDKAQPDPGNLFWIGVIKSESRKAVRAAWYRNGPWVEPFITLEDWTVDECLDLHADERASTADWHELGRLFVAQLKPEQLLYAQ